jgi:hypothetical protein
MMVISKNRTLITQTDFSQRSDQRQSRLKEKEVSKYSGPPDISIDGHSPSNSIKGQKVENLFQSEVEELQKVFRVTNFEISRRDSLNDTQSRRTSMEVKQKVNVKVLELTGVNETLIKDKQDSSSRRSTFRVSIPNFKTGQNVAGKKNSFIGDAMIKAQASAV